MTPLEKKERHAAAQLLELLDHTTPYQRDRDGPDCALSAIHSLAEFAIALAVANMAEITRDLIQKHRETPIVPPQTDKEPKT